jgi:hypothetical protein
MRRFTEIINPGTKWEGKRAVKGVVLIHLFNEVWRIGRAKYVSGKGLHSVIYSPEDKEYHVWGKDVKSFYAQYNDDYDSYYDSHINKPDPAKVKIYILTSIMDNRDNWCFDLKTKPEVGKIVKVIYDNGTIKNITFPGEWTPITIDHNIHIDFEKEPDVKMEKEVKPICFRIK